MPFCTFASISVLLSLQKGEPRGLLLVHSNLIFTYRYFKTFFAIFRSFRHSAGRKAVFG